MHSLTIFLILINILQISHQAPDHDKRRCSEKGCFPAFWKKIFGPKMRKLRKSEFLDFKEETLEDWEKFGDEKCSCGKYSLKEMQKIEYDDDWHFRVLPKPIGKGSTSMIYHAHAMTMSKLKDFDGKPLKLKKCFALKSVLIRKVGYELENEMRNEIEILKRFARINSKRIIRLYDFKDVGKLSKNRQRKLLFLIEMGEHDLFEEFKNMKNIMENIWHRNKDKSEIEKIIKNKFIEILEAVKEMHKLAIHLDLKPENMIYVNEGNKMALKIIDFGGSELIPENSKNIAEKRANVCKLRKEMWHTEFYASPEQRTCCDNYRNYNFSIKSDIWSVGVMLLEMITYAPMYKNGIAQFPVDWALELIKEMFEKGGDLIEIERQGIRLHDILVTLRDQFSHLFSSILKATVNKVPTERTTARGLLDFIPGKCHLKVPLKRIVDKSNPNKVVETIFEQNTQQEMLLPECDQETTGNPLALSDEVKSNELEVKLEENIVV